MRRRTELRANNLISDWFDKDNGNIEHLSRLTDCKRCGPAITKFLSSLLDTHETTACPLPVQKHGTSNNAASQNVLWLRMVDLGPVV